MLYFLLAVGLSIIFGLLQFVNFAHGAFYMLGAYLAYTMVERGVSFWLALPLAFLAVGALAALTEAVLLRRIYAQAHTFHILATVGLALAVQEIVIIVWGPIGANLPPPDSLSGVVILGDFIYPEYRLFVIALTALLAGGCGGSWRARGSVPSCAPARNRPRPWRSSATTRGASTPPCSGSGPGSRASPGRSPRRSAGSIRS